MNTLVDVDEEALKEIIYLTGVKTKKDAINLSLKELVRQLRAHKLRSMLGQLELDIDLEKLKETRKRSVRI